MLSMRELARESRRRQSSRRARSRSAMMSYRRKAAPKPKTTRKPR